VAQQREESRCGFLLIILNITKKKKNKLLTIKAFPIKMNTQYKQMQYAHRHHMLCDKRQHNNQLICQHINQPATDS